MCEIIQALDITKDSARTALRFLLKNGAVVRVEFKIGKMGYSIYRLEKKLYEDIKSGIEKGVINPFSIQKNYLSQKGSNSSSIITTTNKECGLNWENIDVTPLEGIGFNKKYLLQLKNVSTPEIVQESIEHFAFGLKNSQTVKKYNNPIAAFIKVIKRGEAWIEPNYESPKDKALRELVEREKLEKEKREKLVNELISIEFDDWRQALTEDEVKAIVPESSYKIKAAAPKTVALTAYFKKEILLPRLKKEGML